jgi:hypothetical protein
LEKIKHGFKTLAECGGIRGVDDTSSFLSVHKNFFYPFGTPFLKVLSQPP